MASDMRESDGPEWPGRIVFSARCLAMAIWAMSEDGPSTAKSISSWWPMVRGASLEAGTGVADKERLRC